MNGRFQHEINLRTADIFYYRSFSGRSPIKLIRANTIATIAGSLSIPYTKRPSCSPEP